MKFCIETSEEISIHALTYLENNGIFISIHALREESDIPFLSRPLEQGEFQSTLSARRATTANIEFLSHIADFNPRSPRGERPFRTRRNYRGILISIHALREESDLRFRIMTTHILDFNPRSP